MAIKQAKSPLLFSRQKYASALLFLKEQGFDPNNLEKANSYGVTPLTLAVETGSLSLVQDILEMGANPIFANPHGFTPLALGTDSDIYKLLRKANHRYTTKQISCVVGNVFSHKAKIYKITRVINGGSSSIKVFEVENLLSKELFIIKVKFNFYGLELRNYVALHQYIDIFPIKSFELDGKQFNDVFGLVQKLVPGQRLGEALDKSSDQALRDQIIYEAIVALGKLHRKAFVHRDPLPNNCMWDFVNKRAEFVDFDIMRSSRDLTEHQFFKAKIYDFRRLIFGCNTPSGGHIKGLASYTHDLAGILAKVPAKYLDKELIPRILKGADGARYNQFRP